MDAIKMKLSAAGTTDTGKSFILQQRTNPAVAEAMPTAAYAQRNGRQLQEQL